MAVLKAQPFMLGDLYMIRFPKSSGRTCCLYSRKVNCSSKIQNVKKLCVTFLWFYLVNVDVLEQFQVFAFYRKRVKNR